MSETDAFVLGDFGSGSADQVAYRLNVALTVCVSHGKYRAKTKAQILGIITGSNTITGLLFMSCPIKTLQEIFKKKLTTQNQGPPYLARDEIIYVGLRLRTPQRDQQF